MESRHRPAAHFAHPRGPHGRDLVDPLRPVHHPGAFRAERGQGAGHQVDQLRPRHADHLPPGAGRVGQRAEQVERRADAQFPAHRPGVAHRRMEGGREEERDARLVEAAFDRRRRRGEVHAERLEQVRAAATARHRAVAVLGHLDAARRDDHGGQRRDVERMRPVAAGAASVEARRAGARQRHGVRPHRAREADDLRRTLALHRQPDQQARDLRGGGVARHHPLHGRGGLLLAQVLAPQERVEHVTHGVHPSRRRGSCPGCAGPRRSAPTRGGTARRGPASADGGPP